MNGYLPHHRRGPRIDEQRRDPNEWPTVAGFFVFAYVVGVVAIVALAFGVIR